MATNKPLVRRESHGWLSSAPVATVVTAGARPWAPKRILGVPRAHWCESGRQVRHAASRGLHSGGPGDHRAPGGLGTRPRPLDWRDAYSCVHRRHARRRPLAGPLHSCGGTPQQVRFSCCAWNAFLNGVISAFSCMVSRCLTDDLAGSVTLLPAAILTVAHQRRWILQTLFCCRSFFGLAV